MSSILRAVLLSYFKDISTKAKIILAGFAAVLIILLGILLFRDGSQPPTSAVPQGIANLSPLSITDANGITWSLEPVRGQPLSLINESDRKPGLPLVIKTNTVKINEQTISIGLSVEGQAGEKYIAGVMKGRSIESQPIFRILDEEGRTLATGRFEYG